MWKKFVKDYLSFTKKDRVGILVLVTMIFVVVILPAAWPGKKLKQVSPAELASIKKIAAQLNSPDNAPATYREKKEAASAYNYPLNKNSSAAKAVLFYFDPNTLDAAGWQRLGIREKTALTIQKYLSRGGRFRKPEDIQKIYGLFQDDYERLLPYVAIAGAAVVEKKQTGEEVVYATHERTAYPAKKTATATSIEINSADTTVLIALPGIGSKLAARIINFRDKLGGFYTVQQVGETYGLPDSTFNKIQSVLQCNAAAVHQLNINTADANTLKQHPYIRWALANAIVQYRVQHGNFAAVDDLQQLALITPELFLKIRPYLTLH